MEMTVEPQESQDGRNAKNRSHILLPPMTVYTTVQVPTETTITIQVKIEMKQRWKRDSDQHGNQLENNQ